MKKSISFGSKTIVYHLFFVKRKTLGITVTPEMEVIVKSPIGVSMEKINEKVKKKAQWILKQQRYFLSFHPKNPPKKFVSGESHLYLGRLLTLKVKKDKRNDISYKTGILEVKTTNKLKVKDQVSLWYRQKAKEKFFELAQPHIQRFKKYRVEPTGIYLQKMKTRWGSCSSNGKIILNPNLIKAPKKCIEYVIIHELCHLVHPNHTDKFFKLQTKEMPDWEKWKNKLEKNLA